MPKILLTRHGHVDGISPERFRGRERRAKCSRVSSISIMVRGNGTLSKRSGAIRQLFSLFGILRRNLSGFPEVILCRTCLPVRQTPSASSWNIIMTRRSSSLGMTA